MATAASPIHGVGIGLRREHYETLFQGSPSIDFLEIVPENFVGIGGRAAVALERAAARWPIVAHGVSVSLGGPDPFDLDYLGGLAKLLEHVDAPFYSDHACWASADGVVFHDLLPLPFCEAAAERLAERTRELASRIEREVVLENISYYAEMPMSRWSEGQFLGEVLERADAGLLLDVNNVYVNAVNHGRDPVEVLEALPLHRTRQIHLAGFHDEGPRLVDDHGSAVADPVWALFEAAIERVGDVPVLIEWDTRIPPVQDVLAQAEMARTRMRKVLARRDD